MSETTNLVAEVRERGGKGAARATRREDKIPAVIYGGKEEPLMVALDRNALTLTVNKGNFTSKLCTLDIKGKMHQVLPRDVQIHPVTDAPVHVDFLRVTAGTQISVMVPMVFTDHEASPGIKKGGVLNVVRHEVEFLCRADSIPEKFVKSLAGLEIGDSNCPTACSRRSATATSPSRPLRRRPRRKKQPVRPLPPKRRLRLVRLRLPVRRSLVRRLRSRPLPRRPNPRRSNGVRSGRASCIWSWDSAIRAPTTRATGTMLDSWRRTTSSAVMRSAPGASASTARFPKGSCSAAR